MVQSGLTKETVNEGGKLTERQAVQKVIQPCLTALADLHAQAIVHGTILPQNVLFNRQTATCMLAGMREVNS